jgi:hypothetical protein
MILKFAGYLSESFLWISNITRYRVNLEIQRLFKQHRYLALSYPACLTGSSEGITPQPAVLELPPNPGSIESGKQTKGSKSQHGMTAEGRQLIARLIKCCPWLHGVEHTKSRPVRCRNLTMCT